MSEPTDVTPPEDHEVRLVHLTEAQLDALADKVYGRLKKNLFAEIGETVARKFLYLLGLAAVAALAWLGGKGLLK